MRKGKANREPERRLSITLLFHHTTTTTYLQAGELGRLLRECGEAAAVRNAAAAAAAGADGDGGGNGGEGAAEGAAAADEEQGAGAGGGDALSVNVLAAAAQLAREEGSRMLEDVLADASLAALLALAAPAGPPAVCEGALDVLCATATHARARPALLRAGAVSTAASVVARSRDAEALVRALMLCGMLLGGGGGGGGGAGGEVSADVAAGRRELVEAEGGKAVVRLLGLARQQQDGDVKVIARDLLALLTRDEALRGAVEAAIRRAAAEVAAARGAAA